MSFRNDLEGQVVMEGPQLPVRSTLERERAGLRATAFSSTPGIWGGGLTEACGHPIPHTQGFPTSLSNSHSHVTRWWEEQTLEMGCLGENVRVPGTQSRVSQPQDHCSGWVFAGGKGEDFLCIIGCLAACLGLSQLDASSISPWNHNNKVSWHLVCLLDRIAPGLEPLAWKGKVELWPEAELEQGWSGVGAV